MNVNICNFAIFGPIFMKFSPNCRAKELGMLFNIVGSFCSLLDREGVDILPPKLGLGKSLLDHMSLNYYLTQT